PAIAGRPEYPDEALDQDFDSDFYAQYLLLQKISESNFNPALCLRNAVNASAARAILRTQALFLEHCRRARMHTRDRESAPQELARCLMLAYPDHLAVRKDQGTLICRLSADRRGELAKESVCRKARVLIAADIREIKTPTQGIKAILSLAAEINPDWLREHFPENWRSESCQAWNSVSSEVESTVRMWCLGVLMEENKNPAGDAQAASDLLAEMIIKRELPILSWDAAVTEWIGRVAWVARQFPDAGLPAFTDAERPAVVKKLCAGEYRYERIKNKPVLPLMQELLTANQKKFVAGMAPEMIALPSGRKMKLIYDPVKQPRGRARIQDLYGLAASPRVAGNKVAVLIEVLAPNNRAVQITDDLARFWQVHYPPLKKTLSRRYPRHEWR
ncbi:MAG: ATP-dependent helicase C-terminal domain-containing protein, partial [Chitinivibrionales bacterium]|nr:ATP-dependent helicase C-terminal domain-containing protein [Chitinivibrionales bacterium]